MAANKTPGPATSNHRRDFWILLICLLAVLVALFHRSFLPQYVLFNNDGPPGANLRESSRLPDTMFGQWMDLNWLGVEWPKTVPDMTTIFMWLTGPLFTGNMWPWMTLLILGLSAWFFFRRSKLSATAAVLGGLAAALHSDYFSNACWGQVSRPLTLAAMFLALGALQKTGPGLRTWLITILAGMAVGLGVMEGSDIGALFSLVVAAYALFQSWATAEGPVAMNLVRGCVRIAVVAICAGVLAAQSISGLVSTQIHGVAGTQQDVRTKQEQWDWATQWSMPKVETLGLVVPGLFGYRMDSPDGGNYWGKMGRDPAWDRYYASGKEGQPPPGFQRFSGGNNYAGSLMVAGALWALFVSFRKKDATFTLVQKKFIWFWGGLGFVCLLLGLGRFSSFYKFFYLLPYASTIRSPAKFVGIFDWSLIILFAYGMHGLSQRMAGNLAASATNGLMTHLKSWWARTVAFDRRWVAGSAIVMGASLLGWLIYDSENGSLREYLEGVGFDADQAASIAGFSFWQVGWFILFLALTLGSMALVLSGWFAGRRAKLGAMLLGLALVADLAHSDFHWVLYFDFDQKYASNPVIDKLRDRPYEHRVVILPGWVPSAFQLTPQAADAERYLDQLYDIEWAQHHFQRYNVQSLDLVQMSRRPEDYVAFEGAMAVRSGETLFLVGRRWELTNTRYILGLAGFVDLFNREFDPVHQSFHVAEYFDIRPKPGVDRVTHLEELTAETNSTGPYALIEFGGALPRASLYASWQVSTNDDATLKTLADPAFDPAQKVIVSNPIPAPAASTNQDAGTVEFKDYAPKHITLQAQVKAPAVLLLNDRYADNWKVVVDGKPGTLLRCNYLMRGVQLEPGTHTVEFSFQVPTGSLRVTVAAEVLGLLLLAFLVFTREPPQTAAGGNAAPRVTT
jgi:hypothetical protein